MPSPPRTTMPRRVYSAVPAVALTLAIAAAQRAQAGFDTVLVIPTQDANFGNSESIGSNTWLTLLDGGSIGEAFDVGNNLSTNTQVDIAGGTVGAEMELRGQSELNISGGTIGVELRAFNQSTLNLTGGTIGNGFYTPPGGFDDPFDIQLFNGSTFNISGGLINSGLTAGLGSTVNLSGGRVTVGFNAGDSGGLTILGGEYRLNGVDFDTAAVFTLAEGDVLTGTLQDGTPFAFTDAMHDALSNATLSIVALPTLDATPQVVTAPIALPGLRAGQSLTLQDGGVLGNGFTAVDATLNITGGETGQWLRVVDTDFTMTGGTVGDGLNLFDGTTADISGGTIEPGFAAHAGSTVNLLGTRFILGGVDITDTLSATESLVITDREVQLEAQLADGSTFMVRLDSAEDLSNFLLPGFEFVSADATLTFALRSIAGDLDHDGLVGAADLDLVLANWGQSVTAFDYTQGDIDGDGLVGDADLQVVLDHFGDRAPGTLGVPEPGTLGLLGLSASARVRRRGQR